VIAADIPDERLKSDPYGIALVDGRRALTNAEFAVRVQAVAGVLDKRGLRAGDVLAAALPPSIEFVTCVFAAWRLGAAVAPAGYAAADLIVADPADLAHDVISPPVPAAEPESPALVTGAGAFFDQAGLTQAADRLVTWFDMDADTRGPLAATGRIALGVVAPLLAGGSIGRSDPTFVLLDPDRVADWPTGPGVGSLRYAISPDRPLPAARTVEFEQRFGIPVVDAFGPPGCAGCATANPPYGLRKPGTAGLPLPGVDVGVADPRGRLVAAGVTGEVIVRGPSVMRGYRDRPAETVHALRDGWLCTGARGRFDQDGYLELI
jgi:long-chain acyl-CoA synthetase